MKAALKHFVFSYVVNLRWAFRNVLHYFMREQTDIIISLTSYPPRFAHLHLTIKCLLTQSVRPKSVVLWIAHEDIASLPQSVQDLEKAGLQIRGCANIRSYKKLIPCLEAYPGTRILTADDDLFYPRNWLKSFWITSQETDPQTVVFMRGHEIALDEEGEPLPYDLWSHDTNHGDSSGNFVVPTGVGGVLYPARGFDIEVFRSDIFMLLAPTTDDIWFFWFGVVSGFRYQKAAGRLRLVNWRGTDKSALYNTNVGSGTNDTSLANLIETYSWPPRGR